MPLSMRVEPGETFPNDVFDPGHFRQKGVLFGVLRSKRGNRRAYRMAFLRDQAGLTKFDEKITDH
jgi:hypothetical protein